WRAAARGVRSHISPALRHIAGAVRRSVARRPDGCRRKKVRGPILGTLHEDRRGGKNGRPRPEMPNRHPPCPECGETPRSKLFATDGLAPSQPLSRRARLPIESHLIIL